MMSFWNLQLKSISTDIKGSSSSMLLVPLVVIYNYTLKPLVHSLMVILCAVI